MFRLSQATTLAVLLILSSGCVPMDRLARAQDGILDLRRGYELTGRLYGIDGRAEFYWQQLLGPADLRDSSAQAKGEFRSPGTSWVRADGKALPRPPYGYATYVLRIKQAPGQHPGLGLWLGSMGSAYALWVDGRLLSKAGRVGNSSEAFRPGLRRPVVALPLRPEVDLVLQVANFAARRGGPWERTFIGPLEALEHAKLQQDWRQMLVFGSMCIGSIFFFIIYLAWRRDRSFLFFSAVAMLAGLRSVLTGGRLAYELLPDAFPVLFRTDYITFFLLIPAFLYFVKTFLNCSGFRPLNWFYVIAGLLGAAATVALPVSWFTYLTLPYQFVALTGLVYVFYLLARAARDGAREAYIILVGFVVLAAATVNDILMARGIETIVPFETATVGVLLFLFPVAVLLGVRTARLAKQNFELSQTLAETNDALRRFVPAEFLRFLHEDIRQVRIGQVVELDLSVMFVDIRGFTKLSESLGSVESMSFLNGYFSRTNPIVNSRGGFIDKFMGDGFISLFPLEKGGHADNALACALDLQHRVAEHNESRVARGWRPVRVAIAISTGPVALGTVGDRTRMETTVVGDTVNLAARLESMSKKLNTSIMLAGSTKQRLSASYALREIDHVHVRGRKEAVTVYECFENDPPELKQQKQAEAGQLTRGLALMQAGMFQEAFQTFVAVSRRAPADPLPVWHVERARVRLKRAQSVFALRRLLLVEDNLAIAELFGHRLRRANIAITVASGQAEALRLIQEELPDIVVSDLHLDDGDGLELLEAIRTQSDAVGRAVKLYLLTADESPQIASSAQQKNIPLYLKPEGIAELAAELGQVAP